MNCTNSYSYKLACCIYNLTCLLHYESINTKIGESSQRKIKPEVTNIDALGIYIAISKFESISLLEIEEIMLYMATK